MTAHTSPVPDTGDNAEPFYLEVTVTIKMTPDQRDGYATDYDLPSSEVRSDVREHLSEVVSDALGATPNPLLRDYSTYSVSKPR